MINYTLAFACSKDGFIARHSKDNPFEWTSQDDQNHLKDLINKHEWQVMGRLTHELNPNTTRKRIVFSRKFNEIIQINEQVKNQFFFNPDINQWYEFEKICSESALILGGTKVHDFFLYAELIDKIFITVEPLIFEKGVPAFSYINFYDLIPFLKERGFGYSENILNTEGTKLMIFDKIN
tara:strand:+ start:30 stop:569 length:540 start_codon:yes stop_codon:yes gene_type:complete